MIHGTGILKTYIYHTFKPKVGTVNIQYMDPLGVFFQQKNNDLVWFCLSSVTTLVFLLARILPYGIHRHESKDLTKSKGRNEKTGWIVAEDLGQNKHF